MIGNALIAIKKKISSLKEFPLFWTVVAFAKGLECLPYKVLLKIGRFLGTCLYFCVPDLKKTAQLNLSLIYHNTKTLKEKNDLAKQSLQNLSVTLLEIIAIRRILKDIHQKITIRTERNSDNIISPEQLAELFSSLNNKQGAIFFCGHQANWEIPFLFITERYPGIAIAKNIKNTRLQKYLTQLRETRQGIIISPKNGISKSIEALYEGKFVGIVGDQALLGSDYSYRLMGREAWSTTTPALLAYKTGLPVFGISLKRSEDRHEITLTPPILADRTKPVKKEIQRITDKLFFHLEKGILETPEQWMWFHKRWKRKLNPKIRKQYHYSFILILIPKYCSNRLLKLAESLCELYHGAAITVALPLGDKNTGIYGEENIIFYENIDFLKTVPNSFQMVIDFINSSSIRNFYKMTGTLKILTEKDFDKCNEPDYEIGLKKIFFKPAVKIKPT